MLAIALALFARKYKGDSPCPKMTNRFRPLAFVTLQLFVAVWYATDNMSSEIGWFEISVWPALQIFLGLATLLRRSVYNWINSLSKHTSDVACILQDIIVLVGVSVLCVLIVAVAWNASTVQFQSRSSASLQHYSSQQHVVCIHL